eukprot:4613317-Pyramimonas_sp.AAC.1
MDPASVDPVRRLPSLTQDCAAGLLWFGFMWLRSVQEKPVPKMSTGGAMQLLFLIQHHALGLEIMSETSVNRKLGTGTHIFMIHCCTDVLISQENW